MMNRPLLCTLLYSGLCASAIAQIQGTITDESNNPIEHALVSKASDPSVWTKTNEDGNYSLDVNPGTTLRVAAFRCATEETSQPNVQLQADPFLASDVFHLGFDHFRSGDTYTEKELREDLPVGSGKGFFQDNDPETDRVFVDDQVSRDEGGKSLRVKFPAGGVKTSASGLDVRIPLAGTYKVNPMDEDELYVSYWVKFSDDFEFDKCGGKLPSLGGSDVATRENEWKGRIMWRKGGSIQFYMELPHGEDGIRDDSERFWGDQISEGPSLCIREFTSYLAEPGWHNIELHYKLDNGTPNGLFEGWVDGGKGHKIVNSEVFGFYRRKGEGLDNLTINALLLSTFFGGSSVEYEPDHDVYAWFDEFRVSKTRINEYNDYQVVLGNKLQEVQAPFFTRDGTMISLKEAGHYTLTDALGRPVMKGEGISFDISGCPHGILVLKLADGRATRVLH